MKPPWKGYAREAARPASSTADVDRALCRALVQEVGPGVIDAVRSFVGAGAQSSLYMQDREQLAQQVDSCRMRFPGDAAANRVIDAAVVAVRRGMAPDSIALVALETALPEIARSYAQGIEEHYGRKAPGAQTMLVREGMAAAMLRADFSSLAREIATGEAISRGSLKQTGLDHGPAMGAN